MDRKKQKDWVILFYLNGNNELAPEMLQAKLSIDLEGSGDGVDVFVQYGNIENRIVEIIRPGQQFANCSTEPAGVRRYRAGSFGPAAEENLIDANMADPKCLYDFVSRGMENYPANHYMLVLGGHVFQYVGLMPDYSQDKPYLMGYPEMVNALSLIYKNFGSKIDLLVLDTCYFNRIEMLYELGKDKDPPVRQALTYISGGPIYGLPYNDLIKITKMHLASESDKLVHKIMTYLSFDLIAYEISHEKLEAIKKSYNDLAQCYLEERAAFSINPSELLSNFDANLPWHHLLKELAIKMPSLTIDYKNISRSPFGHFYISAQSINDPYKISLYNKLAFSKGNSWPHLLYASNLEFKVYENKDFDLELYILNPNELYALICAMNPDLSFQDVIQIVHSLIEYKGWNLNKPV